MSKRNKDQKIGSNLRIILVLPLLILLLITPILVSYFNLYPSFVSLRSQATLDTLVASIPFIPKTPKQVLTKALAKNQTLSNYHSNFSIKITDEKQDLVNILVSGAIEKAGLLDSESKVKITGNLQQLFGSNLDLETQHFGNDFYFKPITPFKIADVDFSNFKNQWYKVDTAKFQESLGLQAKSDTEIIKDIRDQFQSSQERFLKEDIFSNISKFTEIEKSGSKFFEITFSLKENDIKDLLSNLDLKSKSATLRLLVNKKDFYLVQGTLKAPLEQNTKTIFTASYGIEKIGQNIEVKPLLEAEEIKSAQEFNQIAKGMGKDLSIDQLFTVSQDTGEVGGSFLTFERLIKVFLLLPKAI